jgi:hypothetical protein
MSQFTQKISKSLSDLHTKEAEEYKLITEDFLTYKIGDTIIVGNEIIVPADGSYKLMALNLATVKKDIGEIKFAYLHSAISFSVFKQRGWLNMSHQVKDYDDRLANADMDVAIFSAKAKQFFDKKDFNKHAIYAARLSAAKVNYLTIKEGLRVLEKKAKYSQRTRN